MENGQYMTELKKNEAIKVIAHLIRKYMEELKKEGQD